MQRSSTVSVRQGGAGGFFAAPQVLRTHPRWAHMLLGFFGLLYKIYQMSQSGYLATGGVPPFGLSPAAPSGRSALLRRGRHP